MSGPPNGDPALAVWQRRSAMLVTTINRWRKRGWCTSPSEHPLDRARAALDSAIPLLTGKPTDVADLVREHPEADELRQLPDRELIRRAAREIAIALIMCSRLLIERGTEVISSKPKEGSVLMFAISHCGRCCGRADARRSAQAWNLAFEQGK